jgi:hypothetical protein
LLLASSALLIGLYAQRGTSPHAPGGAASERRAPEVQRPGVGAARVPQAGAGRESKPAAFEAYGKLPLSFEPNRGQSDARVKFLARGNGYALFLTEAEAVLTLRAGGGGKGKARKGAASGAAVLRMGLTGANPRPAVAGSEQLPGKTNYLRGGGAGRLTDIPTYAMVRYAEVYPGVDLVYYGNQGRLEYDFNLAPGADPDAIRFSFSGGDVRLDPAGDLVISTPGGAVRQHRPHVYQEVGGRRVEVAGGYALRGRGQIGFALGDYDRARPLVIDPVLVYSTFIGGGSIDSVAGIAVDAAGNAYVTGTTSSADFPVTPGAPQTAPPATGLRDAFVTKLNAAGNAAVYSTFLGGGDGNEDAAAVAVDSSGSAYVVGKTTSAAGFPVTPGALQTAWGGGGGSDITDAFVAKLDPAGSALVYSTYLGGSLADDASDLVVDAAGHAYVAGTTNSGNFPTTPGVLRTAKDATRNSYVTKLNPAGTAAVYSTFVGVGQQGNDGLPALAVDGAGNAHLAGYTYSDNYPVTPGAFQTKKTSLSYTEAYVTKLNPAGAALVYSTYLGGQYDDNCQGIDLDAAGNIYVIGSTGSYNFPTTPGAYKTQFGASGGAPFVVKFTPAGALVYSTFFGSPTYVRESGRDIAVTPSGESYIIGYTDSTDLPTTPDAFQKTRNGTDTYLAKLNASGSAVTYLTYYGGGAGDFPSDVTLDAAGNVYVVGGTGSSDLPVTPGAFQRAPSSAGYSYGDGFIFKVGTNPPTALSISGRVTDGANGIRGALVRLAGTLEGTQWTDLGGYYSFGNLTAGGDYTVTPQSPYYDFGAQSREFKGLAAGETADFAGAVCRFRVSGRVTDTNGGALPGATLTLQTAQGNATAQTDAAGDYAFADLPAVGSYTLSVSKANYVFTSPSRSFSNLTADLRHDFVGRLLYTVRGRLADASGNPLALVRIDLDWTVNGTAFKVTGSSNSSGDYGFINLTPGRTYSVTPVSPYFSFAPASRTFADIGASYTAADFTGTLIVASIRGRVVDESGRPLPGVTVNVSGGGSGYTNSTGDYTVSALLKGRTYTVTPARAGYGFTPATRVVDLSGDAVADFTARLLPPQPFTPGNVLVSTDHLLYEYTPEGVQVQAAVVPYPSPTPVGESNKTGDLALDANGDAWVLNAKPLTAANYSRSRQAWQSVTLVDTINYQNTGAVAAAGGYVFASLLDYYTGQGTTRGIIRLNLADKSVTRFEKAFEYQDLAASPDGLLYALSYASGNLAFLHAYDQQTLQFVSERVVNTNTRAIAANGAGDLYMVTQSGQVSRMRAGGTIDKQVSVGSETLLDIDVSPDGRVVVSGIAGVTLLDGELHVIGSFKPQTTELMYVAFARPASVASLQFSAASTSFSEGAGRAEITVARTGDVSGPASVEYRTADDPAAVPCDPASIDPATGQPFPQGKGYARCDYATTIDRLTFAPGETTKTFSVPLVDDAYAEGAETVRLTLGRPEGAVLGDRRESVLTITDNETAPGANPITQTSFFVRQHYLDFLSREPESGEPWSATIDNCPAADKTCDRVSVSAAFFGSAEFRLKGFYVFNFYRVAFDRLPAYDEIIPDMRGVTGSNAAELYAKRAQFAASFAARTEFTAAYPPGLTNQQYVDALLSRYSLQSITTPDPASPDAGGKVTLTKGDLATRLGATGALALTRAQVLRAVVQSDEVSRAEYNSAFVAMQYYGYLRRAPEPGGYRAWLDTINANPADSRSMVNGFMNSEEYRLRFGRP